MLLLLVVVGLVAAAVWLATRRRRRLEAWDAPAADAEAGAHWLHDRVLPSVLAAGDPVQAAAAWSAVRPRFLELDEQLTGLARTAPDDERLDEVTSLRGALADLGAALDERSAATSREAWATANLRVELARDRLERRLARDPSAMPGRPDEAFVPRPR